METVGPQRNEPTDVPTTRHEALDRLERLVGRWQMEAQFPAGAFGPTSPPITDRGGYTTFEWLDGRFFLIQRFTNKHPAAPNGIAIIGLAAGTDSFYQHYYDSRGVARTYHMALDEDTWEIRSDTAGFSQRYRATASSDGTRFDGAWESSPDGSHWTLDFRLAYLSITTGDLADPPT